MKLLLWHYNLSFEIFWILSALNLIIWFAVDSTVFTDGLSGVQSFLLFIDVMIILGLLLYISIHRYFLWKLTLYPIWGDPVRESFRQEFYETYSQVLDRRDFGSERENRLLDIENEENYRERL